MADSFETPIGTITPENFRPGRLRHKVFLGPKFLYGLFSPSDRMHPVSRAFMTYVRTGELPFRRLVVNEHVVDETATRLKKKASLRNAAKFLETLDESSLYRLEPVEENTFDEATTRFVEWDDLGASLTDFIVAAHADALDVDHVVTYDDHYDAFDVTPLPYRR